MVVAGIMLTLHLARGKPEPTLRSAEVSIDVADGGRLSVTERLTLDFGEPTPTVSRRWSSMLPGRDTTVTLTEAVQVINGAEQPLAVDPGRWTNWTLTSDTPLEGVRTVVLRYEVDDAYDPPPTRLRLNFGDLAGTARVAAEAVQVTVSAAGLGDLACHECRIIEAGETSATVRVPFAEEASRPGAPAHVGGGGGGIHARLSIQLTATAPR